MSDAGDGDPVDWQEAVDVICVGTSPGVAAYAAACAAAGLDVMTVDLPADGPDPATRSYLDAMTADLGDGPPPQPAPPIRARPVRITPARTVKHDRLDPFVGEELRQWSAGCALDSSGVLFTAVPDHLLVPMRTDAGGLITAVALPSAWGSGAACGTLLEMVHSWGRIAGALVSEGPEGSEGRLVRAEHGLAFGVGPAGSPPDGADALVGRRAGRFARLQALEVLDE